MAYFKVCPHCGANLDPGESCDCEIKEKPPEAAERTDGDEQKNPETAEKVLRDRNFVPA